MTLVEYQCGCIIDVVDRKVKAFGLCEKHTAIKEYPDN